MRRNDGLTEVADELIYGEFVLIWHTPEGFPYCPTRVIAIMEYLKRLTPCVLDSDQKVVALQRILSHREMRPERRAMVEVAIEQVFPFARQGLSAECSRENSLCHLASGVFGLDMCVSGLETAIKRSQ